MGCAVRVWRLGRGRLRPVIGCDGVAAPPIRVTEDRTVTSLDQHRRLAAVPRHDGYWYEIVGTPPDPTRIRADLEPLLATLLESERETLQLAKLLAARYEEIELLYTISEILGRTVHLDEAAQTIVESVSQVVGARRASILVHDPASRVLRGVASVGPDVRAFAPIALDDERSVAARVFREGQALSSPPWKPSAVQLEHAKPRRYRGSAFLSVPIVSAPPEGVRHPVGVINLTDRAGRDAFSGGERRLVQAAASQIGVAIENARLVARDRDRARLRHELDLAHDLQLKLLPSVDSLGAGVDLGAACRPAESVGGDFYNFLRLPGGQIGVMVGDVSSHGFSAALIMALVLSAAGISAEEAATADAALRGLLHAISDELAETEMFLTLFYAVANAATGRLSYANAGHPHAFRLAEGMRERLGATSPPLGITRPEDIAVAQTAWVAGRDVLVLFSDGIADAANQNGEPFGEDRVLTLVERSREVPARDVAERLMTAVAEFAPAAVDDRTVLILRA